MVVANPALCIRFYERSAAECLVGRDSKAVNAEYEGFESAGPVLYLGSPWMRNFYITNTFPTAGAPLPTVTVGCAKGSSGVCTRAPVQPQTTIQPGVVSTSTIVSTATSSTTERRSSYVTSGGDGGVAVAILVGVLLATIILFYVLANSRRKAGHSQASYEMSSQLLHSDSG